MLKPWLHTGLLRKAFNDDDFGAGKDDEEEVVDVDDDDVDEEEEDDEDEDEDEDDEDDEDDDNSAKGGFNPEVLGDAIGRALKGHLGKGEGNPQGLTREELEKRLGKPQLSEDLIRKLRDPEATDAVQALEGYMSQMAEYVLKASGLAIEGKVKELDPRLSALQQHVATQQRERFVQDVQRKFPALKGRRKVIEQALNGMMAQGYQARSKSGTYRDVAKAAASIIRTVDENFKLKSPKKGNFLPPARGGSGGGNGKGKGGKGIMDLLYPVG